MQKHADMFKSCSVFLRFRECIFTDRTDRTDRRDRTDMTDRTNMRDRTDMTDRTGRAGRTDGPQAGQTRQDRLSAHALQTDLVIAIVAEVPDNLLNRIAPSCSND